MSSKRVIAIRHVAFEDLGIFEGELLRRGYAVEYRDAGVDDLDGPAFDAADLLVALGGPIGAYEDAAYPFLTRELALIERRLRQERPIVGVCLGAQMIARVLGARVYPGPRKEIGFSSLSLTDAGQNSCLVPLGEGDRQVLHWHGDTFDLPQDAVCLASTTLTPHQAFGVGASVLGLQFHAEARLAAFERWLIGHACEIASVAGLSVTQLRATASTALPAIEGRGAAAFARWLDDAGL